MFGALAVLFLLAALFSLFELIRFRALPQIESYITDREAQATHLVMNGGMAAMLAPFYGPTAEQVVLVVYVLGATALSARLVLARAGRSAGTVYHLLGLAAMIYATTAMPAMTAGDMHRSMAMGATGGIGHKLATSLGVIFLLDGVATLVLAGFFPHILLRMEQASNGSHLRRATMLGVIRASAVPHVIMDLGMAWMLIGIL